MTRSEKNDFAGFCRNATDAQVEAIIEKERDAGRTRSQRIAAAGRERRAELAAARHPRWGR